jgi:hypothetical protein
MPVSDKYELIIEDEPSDRKHVEFHPLVDSPNGSRWVESMIMLFASISVPDGETSAGHQRFRRLTEDEIIEQAFSLAERTLDEMVKRGWAFKIPSHAELKKTAPVGFTASNEAARGGELK